MRIKIQLVVATWIGYRCHFRCCYCCCCLCCCSCCCSCFCCCSYCCCCCGVMLVTLAVCYLCCRCSLFFFAFLCIFCINISTLSLLFCVTHTKNGFNYSQRECCLLYLCQPPTSLPLALIMLPIAPLFPFHLLPLHNGLLCILIAFLFNFCMCCI